MPKLLGPAPSGATDAVRLVDLAGYASVVYVDEALGGYLEMSVFMESMTELIDDFSSALSQRAPLVHSHAVADVTGLQAALDGKEASVSVGSAEQYWRGDKTWQTLPTYSVPSQVEAEEGTATTSRVWTAQRVRQAVTAATQTALNGKEGAIAAGTTAQYWRGDKTWQTLPTYSVPSQVEAEEGTATTSRVWTAQRVRQAVTAATQTALDAKAPVTSPTFNGFATVRADYAEVRFRAASGANANMWRLVSDVNGSVAGGFVLQGTTDGFSSSFINAILVTPGGVVSFPSGVSGVAPLSNPSFPTNATVGNTLMVGNQIVLRGNGTEGGQVTLGYKEGTGLTGASDGTWVIDVSASNSLRIFKRNLSATVTNLMVIDEGTGQASFTQPTSSVRWIAETLATSGNPVFHEFKTEVLPGTTRGTIDYDRSGNLTRYNTTSDARLKQHEGFADVSHLVTALRVHEYRWRENPAETHIGFFAQELHAVVPDAVRVGGDDPATEPWQVDASVLVPYLTAALQDALARIERLEAQWQSR